MRKLTKRKNYKKEEIELQPWRRNVPLPGLSHCGPDCVVYLLADGRMLLTDGHRYEKAALESQRQGALFMGENTEHREVLSVTALLYTVAIHSLHGAFRDDDVLNCPAKCVSTKGKRFKGFVAVGVMGLNPRLTEHYLLGILKGLLLYHQV